MEKFLTRHIIMRRFNKIKHNYWQSGIAKPFTELLTRAAWVRLCQTKLLEDVGNNNKENDEWEEQ